MSRRIASCAPRARLISVVADSPATLPRSFFVGVTTGIAVSATAALVLSDAKARSPAAADTPQVDMVKLQNRVNSLEIANCERVSSAYVFIKPHAVTDKAKELVRERLAANGITVISEGVITAEKIDKELLIDTHYGAIAAKAVKQKPASLTVQPKAQEAFLTKFGLSWDDANKQGKVFNAMDAAAKLGISNDELGAKFSQGEKLKFGGGFYCGKVDDIYVINGFYMGMRKKFTTPGTSIYYYETEWSTSKLAWADFRGKVLGSTDPKTAAAGSLRNDVFKDWKNLGLASEPNTGDNGVHASASPFEALAERANWLGRSLETDPFCKAMLASGVSLGAIKAWTDDPPVNFQGKKVSMFDLVEDLDGRECLKKSASIFAQQ